MPCGEPLLDSLDGRARVEGARVDHVVLVGPEIGELAVHLADRPARGQRLSGAVCRAVRGGGLVRTQNDVIQLLGVGI